MSLDEYTYADGRKVSFDRSKVVLLEPHTSGSGTLVRLLIGDSATEMHLSEEYTFLKERVAESWMDRAFRELHENPEVPF